MAMRTDFCHPYQPYEIQLQFMSNLYQCIEDGKVGVFESPTGTGKSLSLICGSLTWLRDHKRGKIDAAVENFENDGEPEWLLESEMQEQRRNLLQQRRELEQRLSAVRTQEIRRTNRSSKESHFSKKPRTNDTSKLDLKSNDDDRFMLEDYDSGDEQRAVAQKPSNGLSTGTQALLDRLKGGQATHEEEDRLDEAKIIFCSRTHSQLSQFVSELRRVKPPSSMTPDNIESGSGTTETGELVKHLSLGSRKNLCINPKVSRLGSTAAINDRCLDLQKPGTAQDLRCSLLPSKDNQDVAERFRDHALAKIRDIEDLGKLGQSMGICPYYASRSAITASEILTLPYPLLLQRSAREALGVSIKDHIVIIDEAHNLMDAIADTYSMVASLPQLDHASLQLTTYVQRFRSRLKGSNRVYVTQIIRLLNSISDCLRQTASTTRQSEVGLEPAQLMAGKGVDQIKPHKLMQYLQESKLAQKVEGYAESKQEGSKEQESTPGGKGALMHLQGFLAVLMNPSAEGRLFFSRVDQEIAVRYVLLDPREHFRDIVEDARSVILAGGTMSPMGDYADYLFSYLPPENLRTYGFGHVIPAENLFVRPVSRGPSGVDFDFTFENRRSEGMVKELGHMIHNTCRLVPDGVVVFFPSYDYLTQVMDIWKQPAAGVNIWKLLGSTKKVFEESKGIASSEELLRQYTLSIDSGKGGLLLSVVGGKLSEGINFSDKLGRAVLAVGLPYPNMQSAVWKAKIEHVEKTRYERLSEEGVGSERDHRAQAKAAGRDFYENACMRAVNQCIGRAIRHRNDYASILLVDKRYSTQRIQKKLPHWIQESMEAKQSSTTFAETERGLQAFFSSKF